MSEPIPGYDLWKLDNGPYEDDGEPAWFSDAYDQYMMGLEDRAREPDARDSNYAQARSTELHRRRKRFPGELYPDGTVIAPEAYEL